jgi:hypothetical protein
LFSSAYNLQRDGTHSAVRIITTALGFNVNCITKAQKLHRIVVRCGLTMEQMLYHLVSDEMIALKEETPAYEVKKLLSVQERTLI